MVTENQIEEYRTLRNEIAQNRADGLRILQIALTLSAAILTLAYSEFIDASYRWLYLFLPCVILTPLNMLIAQRTRVTWIIGRYVQQELEPKLGFHWETMNFFRKTGIYLVGYSAYKNSGEEQSPARQIIPFVWGTGGTLAVIQAGSVLLAAIELFAVRTTVNFIEVLVFGSLALAAGYSVYRQVRMSDHANRPEAYAIMKKRPNPLQMQRVPLNAKD